MAERRQQPRRRLRKQPDMRRVRSATAVSMPRIQVPQTAQKRRRRNNRPVRIPWSAIRTFAFSARWLSLSLLAIALYALITIGQSDQFYLRVIPVEGAIAIQPGDIIAASGLAGVHIFAADPIQAAHNVAELPGVVSARVSLSWPNEVSIQVEEETPVAIWQEGEKTFWITEDGRLIDAPAPSAGLLVIESETAGETAVPTMHFIPQEILAGALQLRELLPNLNRLNYRPSTGLSYQDDRGWQVYMGVGTNMPQKLAIYETIVEDLLARGLTPIYISVSNQEKPYYSAR
ncbi:MAG: FtsQ-type POTRA domain-containing protein [Chloroflexi bacterium]|nr:MAG: FtsQ-type POTRA domain-containing protein [Chloroflexota bacterium]